MDALALGLSVLWVIAVWKLGEFWSHSRRWLPQLHHSYFGQAAYFIGRFTGHAWLEWAGLACLADDATQHLIQIWKPEFRSPLHLLARYTFYRIINV